MRKLLFFGILTFMGVGFYFLFKHNIAFNKLQIESSVTLSKDSGASKKTLAVSRENVSQSSSYSSISIEYTKTPKRVAFSSSSSQKAYLETYAKAKEEMDSYFNKINSRLAVTSNKPVIEVIDDLFKEESVDISWADENEARIYNFFRQSPAFSSFSPEWIECKTNSCKVVISLTDQESAINVRDKVSEQVSAMHANIPGSYMAVTDATTGKLILYFQKAGI